MKFNFVELKTFVNLSFVNQLFLLSCRVRVSRLRGPAFKVLVGDVVLLPARIFHSSEVLILARCAEGDLWPQQAGSFHGHLVMKRGRRVKDRIRTTVESVNGRLKGGN